MKQEGGGGGKVRSSTEVIFGVLSGKEAVWGKGELNKQRRSSKKRAEEGGLEIRFCIIERNPSKGL